MKMKLSQRLTAGLLAIVVMFLMIPFSSITVNAAGAEISAGDGGYIGKTYNALGNIAFGEDALTLDDIFTNKDDLIFEIRPKDETNCTYSLVDDFSSYAYNQSSSLDASIDISAKIKIVKLSASAKYSMSSSSSSSGEQHSEYFVMEVTHIENTSYMNISPSMLKKLWMTNNTINPEFITAINTMKAEEFFKQYGTHIVTGYSAGGYSYASYEGESLATNASFSDSRNVTVGLGMDISTFVGLKGEMKISENSDGSTSTSNNSVLSGRATVGGNGNILDLSKDGVNTADVNNYIDSITNKNSRIIVDDNLKMLSVWDFVYASGDKSLYSAAQALEEYYYEHIDGEKEQIGGYSEAFLDYADCKIITTPEELNEIRNDLDGNYVLACNIDLSEYANWEPIGSKLNPFTGRFYGNSNTILGLNITSCTDNIAGLFGYNNGTIHGVRVEGNIAVDSASSVGAIAAYNNGTISDCYDAVIYDVDYFSLTDINLGLRKIDLETFSAGTITIGNENGIYLVGNSDKTYTGINIVVEDNNVESPAYIVLENANIVGGSTNATIYSDGDRPIYIVSTGTANTISGANAQSAINVANSEVFFFGNAELFISGGNGITATTSGDNGTAGATAVIANNVIADMKDRELTIIGGNGGDGGNGDNGSNGVNKGDGSWWSSSDGGNGSAGKDGGDGAIGGMAIDSNNIFIVNGTVKLVGGDSGNGGNGGSGGNGGKGADADAVGADAGDGGNGGNGGNGGDAYYGVFATIATTIVSEKANLHTDCGKSGTVGEGGNAGSGGSGGRKDGWAFASSGDNGHSGTDGSTGILRTVDNTMLRYNENCNDAYTNVTTFQDTDSKNRTLKGILSGHSNPSNFSVINDSTWNKVTLSINSITQINHFSGDEFDKSTISVSSNGENVYYDYSFNSQRVGINYIKISDGNCTRLIPVYVTETVPTSIEIVEPGKVEFVKNAAFVVDGLKIKVIYNNGSEAYLDETSEGVTWTTPSLASEGSKTVSVYYDYDSDVSTPALEASYTIDVVRVSITHIEIKNNPNKVEYAPNEKFNPKGLVIEIFRNDGSAPEEMDYTNEDLKYIYDFSVAGSRTVTVDYNGYKAYIECAVTSHAFGDWYTVEEADHYKEGIERRDCDYSTSGHYDCFETRVIPAISHTFDKQVVADEYKKSDATFISPVIYYYSCECGEKGEETFTYGEALINENAPRIIVDDNKSTAGKTIRVNIRLENNPGIASMKLKVTYDESILSLQSDEYNNMIGGQSQQPQSLNSPVTLNWYNGIGNSNGDFVYATLVFAINSDAGVGTSNVTVTYDPEDVYDISYSNVEFAVQAGKVQILDHIPGDISGDGSVNNKDLSLLFQYLSDWNVKVNQVALDVNGDGKVNNKDLSLLFQYLSDWNVEIH